MGTACHLPKTTHTKTGNLNAVDDEIPDLGFSRALEERSAILVSS
jgi:hypothetical protein